MVANFIFAIKRLYSVVVEEGALKMTGSKARPTMINRGPAMSTRVHAACCFYLVCAFV